MKLYVLGISPKDYDGDGENHDEWFSSLYDAMKRRNQLLSEPDCWKEHRYGEDFEIHAVTLARLPLKRLLLAILNRSGWHEKREIVVAAATAPKEYQRELLG